MSAQCTGLEARLHAAEVFGDKWLWLVLLGNVQIMQATRMPNWVATIRAS